MRRLLAVGLAVLALPLASCSGGGGDDDQYVLRVDGVARTSDGERLGAGRHELEVGQRVEVLQGTAVLGLPGEASLELRAGDPGSLVEVGPEPTLLDGDALALATSGDSVRLVAGRATVAVRGGAARVRRASGVTVGVYEGEARIEAEGQDVRRVKALRQVGLADTGTLPVAPTPLVYDRRQPDPWDLRYLADAIDLGGVLERKSRALSAELSPPASLDAPFLQQVVPALASVRGLAGLVDASRSVGESVVGASIALGGPGDFGRRWERAFSFREEGADWGLVALDQRAGRSAVQRVLDGVLAAIPSFARTRTTTAGAVAPRTTSTTTPPRTNPGPDTPQTPTTPGLPPITVPILPSPNSPPPPTNPSSPPTSPNPTVPEPTSDLLGQVEGLLQPVTGPTQGAIGGLLDVVDGLLAPR